MNCDWTISTCSSFISLLLVYKTCSIQKVHALFGAPPCFTCALRIFWQLHSHLLSVFAFFYVFSYHEVRGKPFCLRWWVIYCSSQTSVQTDSYQLCLEPMNRFVCSDFVVFSWAFTLCHQWCCRYLNFSGMKELVNQTCTTFRPSWASSCLC